MSNDVDAQTDELLALESIFADCFHSYNQGFNHENENSGEQSNLKGGELKIYFKLPQPFYLTFVNNLSGELEKQPIEHLPPLCLHFTFPKLYPSTSPPNYTLSCKWINSSQLSSLCKELDNLWTLNSGNVVMFTWAQYLQEETLHLLNLTDSLMVPSNNITSTHKSSERSRPDCDSKLEDSNYTQDKMPENVDNTSTVLDQRAIQDIGPTINLVNLLKDYDGEMRKTVFDSKVFNCKVCLCERTGINCIEFWPCYHVYCKECMRSYFEIQIKEGNIKYLKCPEDKCNSEANPKQVENLVSDDLYHKWDSMLLNSTLSSLGDIQLCPRQHCQYPVTLEDQQGQCPSCSFVFCGICRFGWHGLEKCRLKKGEARNVIEKYMNGSLAEKKVLESKYGKKYCDYLVTEFLSESYLDNYAKTCPKCQSSIEKIDGCNKMTCKRCSTNFCWLCANILDCMNPYYHFNNPKSECFNMLFNGMNMYDDFFDLEDSDEEEDD